MEHRGTLLCLPVGRFLAAEVGFAEPCTFASSLDRIARPLENVTLEANKTSGRDLNLSLRTTYRSLPRHIHTQQIKRNALLEH
jgi:hypothetical protein